MLSQIHCHWLYYEKMPNKGAAANSHCSFSFDRAMKFKYHFALLSPPPVAVAELTSEVIRQRFFRIFSWVF